MTISPSAVTPNAIIRYTEDGSMPTSSSTLYTVPITLNTDKTITAKSFLAGLDDNDAVAVAEFQVNLSSTVSLSAFADDASLHVDLTAEGGLDWSHWGLNSNTDLNQKNNGGTGEIGDFVEINGLIEADATQSTASPVGFSWSDGNGAPPDDSVTEITNRVIFVHAPNLEVDEGVRLTIPVDTTAKTLKVYVGAYSLQGKITATLSNAGGSDVTYGPVFLDNPYEVQKVWVVTFNFSAAAAGETLTVEYTMAADTGNTTGGHINIAAATLD